MLWIEYYQQPDCTRPNHCLTWHSVPPSYTVYFFFFGILYFQGFQLLYLSLGMVIMRLVCLHAVAIFLVMVCGTVAAPTKWLYTPDPSAWPLTYTYTPDGPPLASHAYHVLLIPYTIQVCLPSQFILHLYAALGGMRQLSATGLHLITTGKTQSLLFNLIQML